MMHGSVFAKPICTSPMKRKLLRKNKRRISEQLKRQRCDQIQRQFDSCQITYDSISELKRLGQFCHQTRLDRQQKMNPRQLKKIRKRQSSMGLIGSKFGGICKTPLKPAQAFLKTRGNRILGEIDIIQKLGEFRELPMKAIVNLPELMSEINSSTKRNPKLIDSCLLFNIDKIFLDLVISAASDSHTEDSIACINASISSAIKMLSANDSTTSYTYQQHWTGYQKLISAFFESKRTE